MGLSSSTQANSDSSDHFSVIVNPKKEKAVVKSKEEPEKNVFATQVQAASMNSGLGGNARCVVLDSRASIIKRIDTKLLWDNFIKGNYMSFALTQSEVTTLLKKSYNDVGMSDEIKAIIDTEIAGYIELIEELSQKDFGNPKVIDFMAMCSSTLLLANNTIEFKVDWLYLWVTMSQDAGAFDFKQ
jgi:hypothetical protein